MAGFNVPAYNPTPIQSRQNALLQGLDMQRAQQGNALQAMQMQALVQRQQQAQAEAAAQAQAEQRRQTYLGSVSGQAGPPAEFNPLQAFAAGFRPDEIKALAPQEQKLYSLGAGMRLAAPDGRIVAEAPFKPEPKQLPAAAQEYEYAKQNGFRGTFEQWKRGPAPAGGGMTPAAMVEAGGVNQLALSKQFGKAAPGYRWKADGTQEAVPGGPADRKNTDAGIREQRNKEGAVKQADRVIAKVDEAMKLVGLNTAGMGGAVLASLPGTDARDLAATLETVKANLGFAELQAMREASPTGGALGAIAVQELIALQSTVASLDQKQSPDQLRKSLGDIKRHYSAWKDAVTKAGAGGATQAPAATGGWKIERVN